jgi:hypothetical protein
LRWKSTSKTFFSCPRKRKYLKLGVRQAIRRRRQTKCEDFGVHALRHKIYNLIIIMHNCYNYDSTQLSRTGKLIQTKRFNTNNMHYIYDSYTFNTIPSLYEQRGGKRIISLEHTKHTDINALQPSKSINQSFKKLNRDKTKSNLFPKSQIPRSLRKIAKNNASRKSESITLPAIPSN